MVREQTIEIRWHDDFLTILFDTGFSDIHAVLKHHIGELGFGSSLKSGGIPDGKLVFTFQDQDMKNRGNYLALWVLVYLSEWGWRPTSHEKNWPHSIQLVKSVPD